MIKKEITFTNFNDEEVTEEHYFHLSKSELIDMELETEGGLSTKLAAIVEGADVKEILQTFRDIIAKSYGQRDPVNASKFFKSPRISSEFMGSLAFDALYSELMTSSTAAAEFVTGLIPKDMAADPEVRKALAEAGVSDPNVRDSTGAQPRTLTDVKLESVGVGAGLFTDEESGLNRPRKNSVLLPWAFRAPTDAELHTMDQDQLMDVFRRRDSGWTPPQSLR